MAAKSGSRFTLSNSTSGTPRSRLKQPKNAAAAAVAVKAPAVNPAAVVVAAAVPVAVSNPPRVANKPLAKLQVVNNPQPAANAQAVAAAPAAVAVRLVLVAADVEQVVDPGVLPVRINLSQKSPNSRS